MVKHALNFRIPKQIVLEQLPLPRYHSLRWLPTRLKRLPAGHLVAPCLRGPFRRPLASSLRRRVGGFLGLAEQPQPGGLFPLGALVGQIFGHGLGSLAGLHFLFLEIPFGPLQGLL